ncbi:MAG TPA: hypothetical protein VIL82_10815 [Solirubrobacteraceae bacterium]
MPFVDAATSVLGFAAFLAYLAGFTSIFGTLIAATNSQARIIFSSGREGLLPSWVAQVTERQRTPWAAFVSSSASLSGSASSSAGTPIRSYSSARSPRWARS